MSRFAKIFKSYIKVETINTWNFTFYIASFFWWNIIDSYKIIILLNIYCFLVVIFRCLFIRVNNVNKRTRNPGILWNKNFDVVSCQWYSIQEYLEWWSNLTAKTFLATIVFILIWKLTLNQRLEISCDLTRFLKFL